MVGPADPLHHSHHRKPTSMATLHRPERIVWTLDGKRVKPGTPGAERTVQVSKTWFGLWLDADGKRVHRALSPNRRAAVLMAAEAERKAQRVRDGLEARDDERHPGRPVAANLAEYERHLLNLGNTPDHVTTTVARIRKCAAACGWRLARDIDAVRLAEAAAKLTRPKKVLAISTGTADGCVKAAEALGISYATLAAWRRRGCPLPQRGQVDLAAVADWHNATFPARAADRTRLAHVKACKAFTRWLHNNRRLPADPLVAMSADGDGAEAMVRRRALAANEFARLLAATEAGREVEGLDGPTRALAYRFAALTGLRRDEVGAVTPARLDFAAGFVSLPEGGATKNWKGAEIPLRADLAERLAAWIAERRIGRDQPLFPVAERDGAAMLRADLEAAGLPYRDGDGRQFDFHALRSQFGTDLARAGVPLATAQKLLRHSTPALTARHYTHLNLADLAGAVEQLPAVETGLSGAAEAAPRVRRRVHSSANTLGQDVAKPAHCPQFEENRGQTLSAAEAMKPSESLSETGQNQNEDDGTRTRNLRIDSPVL